MQNKIKSYLEYLNIDDAKYGVNFLFIAINLTFHFEETNAFSL